MSNKKLACLAVATMISAALIAAPAQARGGGGGFGGGGGRVRRQRLPRGGDGPGLRWPCRLRRSSGFRRPPRLYWPPRFRWWRRLVGWSSPPILPAWPPFRSAVLRPWRRPLRVSRILLVLDLGADGVRLATSLGVRRRLL